MLTLDKVYHAAYILKEVARRSRSFFAVSPPNPRALAAAGVLGAAVLLLFACKKPRDQKGETC